MILNGCTDNLEIKLDDDVQTNQLSYYCVYTEDGITKSKYGLTYNTSNIDLIFPSKNLITVNSIIIHNLDTAIARVKIQIFSNRNRIVIYSKVLGIGENIQYNGRVFENIINVNINEGGSSNEIIAEIPSGVIDGDNDLFTLDNEPINGISLFLNGQRLTNINDYTLSGIIITMINIPYMGDSLTVDYKY